MARENISNSYKIAEANACDVLSQVGNFGLNIRDPRCVLVAANVCLSFSELCEASNAIQLLDCGAPALVVLLLRLHIADLYFAYAAVRALCGLSSLHVKLREEVGRCDGCRQVVDVLQHHHANISVVQLACEAIMHLSLSPSNTAHLSEAGACACVVDAFKTKLMENDFGAEVCRYRICSYIYSLHSVRSFYLSLLPIVLPRLFVHIPNLPLFLFSLS